MPGLTNYYTAVELILVALAAVLVGLLVRLGYRAWRNSRITPEERERRRRDKLVATGKITDAMLVEIRDDLVLYSYGVRGVEYMASQDISKLVDKTALDFSGISAMSVRYDPRNPANSIVVAETWSGLHGALRLLPDNHATH